VAGGPAAVSVAKTGHQQRLVGQVSWDRTEHYETDSRDAVGSGEVYVENSNEHGSMNLSLPLRGTGTSVGKSTYTVNLLGEGDAKEFGPQLRCEKLTKTSASGAGPIPKDGFGTTILSAGTDPHPKIGPLTESIMILAVLPFEGTQTESELYCIPDTFQRTVGFHAAMGGEGDGVCYPAGVKHEPFGKVNAGTLVGAWHQATKSFDFTCKISYLGGSGATITLSVTGKLKLK
jgi:hypothetical protein